MSRTAGGRLISGVLLDNRCGARHRAPTSECMSWFLPRLSWWRAAVCSSSSYSRSGRTRRAAAGPSSCRSDQSWPKAALHETSAERGEWSSPVRHVRPGDYRVTPLRRPGMGTGLGRRRARPRVKAGRARGRGRPPRRGFQRPACDTGRAGGSSPCSVRHRAAGRSHGATIGWPAAEGPHVLWR
jgi:hypothetical protein